MYKTSVYTLVNGNISGLAHRKQQKLQKVILPAPHWWCVTVLLTGRPGARSEISGPNVFE